MFKPPVKITDQFPCQEAPSLSDQVTSHQYAQVCLNECGRGIFQFNTVLSASLPAGQKSSFFTD